MAVISRRMADQFWPGEDPVGRPIRIGGPAGAVSTIVGIVGDVRSLEVTQAPQPEMYQPLAQTRVRTMRYVLKSDLDSAQVLSAAQAGGGEGFDSRLPLIAPGTMAALVDSHLARPRFYLLLLWTILGAGGDPRRGRHLRRRRLRRDATHAGDRRAHGARRPADARW